jgi:hypothetical protein
MQTTWKHYHYGLTTQRKKPVSYNLVYPNGVTVLTQKPYPYCLMVKKKSHPYAEITPNF